MIHHNARPRLWAGRWRGDCSACGWLGRYCADEAAAQRQAERHNVKAAERDAAAFDYLFGPKKKEEN